MRLWERAVCPRFRTYRHTETVTVWLYPLKQIWLRGLGLLQSYRRKSKKIFLRFSASQRAPRLAENRVNSFLTVHEYYCAQAEEIVGKAGQK